MITHDLAVVPLDGVRIGVEWRAVHRPDPADAVVDLVDTIRRLVPSTRPDGAAARVDPVTTR